MGIFMEFENNLDEIKDSPHTYFQAEILHDNGSWEPLGDPGEKFYAESEITRWKEYLQRKWDRANSPSKNPALVRELADIRRVLRSARSVDGLLLRIDEASGQLKALVARQKELEGETPKIVFPDFRIRKFVVLVTGIELVEEDGA